MDKVFMGYFASDYIQDWCRVHPLHWMRRERAQRGGPGDRAGATPTPALAEFMGLIAATGSLPAQDEYAYHCVERWTAWYEARPPEVQEGVLAKLYNNFYPAGLDALHVHALLVESGQVDCCILDTEQDVVHKTDLLAQCGSRVVRIALLGPSAEAAGSLQYKRANRNAAAEPDIIAVQLPRDRPKSPGNKRWFAPEDFEFLLQELKRLERE